MRNIIISTFRKKSNYIIFLVLFVSTYLICGMFLNIFFNYSSEINNLKYDKRIYSLEINIDLNKRDLVLENNGYIDYYFPIFSNQVLKYNDRFVTINYFNMNTITIFNGKEIEKENDLIISSLLYEKLGYEGDPFGKKIELFIDGDIYEFNIVGITKNLSSQIYLKLETFKEIFNLEETKFYITPKNYESYQKLMELFLVNNIDSELSDLTSIDKIDSIKSIKYIYLLLLIVIMFMEYIFVAVIINSMIRNEIKDIAVFKALGYKYNLIKKIMLIRISIIIVISYFISIILVSCLSLFKIMKFDFLRMFNYYNLITIFILIYVLFVISKFGRKLKNMNVLNVLEDL